MTNLGFGSLGAANEVISHCELLIDSGDVAAIEGDRYDATGELNYREYLETLGADE